MKKEGTPIGISLLLVLLLLAIWPSAGRADTAVTFTATGTNVEGFATEKYTNIFDGITTNKWCGNFSDETPVYVDFESSLPVRLSNYYLYTGNDNGGGSRNPVNWTLYARKNVVDEWESISCVVNGTLPTANSTRSATFEIDDSKKFIFYNYFRFEISSIGDGNVFEIGEIGFDYSAFSFDGVEVVGEEYTPGNGAVRSGRVSSVAPVTIDGCTYTLYKDYSYCPVENGVRKEDLKRSVPDYSCVLTGCTKTGSLDIPSSVTFTYNGMDIDVRVSAIGENVFSMAHVTSVSVPPTVVFVERSALVDRASGQPASASTLATLSFENGKQSLFLYAGSDSYGPLGLNAALTNVFIGRPMEYEGTGKSVFEGSVASGLSVAFDDSVKTIPACMFRNVASLTDLRLPASLTAIPASMCEGCIGLDSIVVPASVASIGDYAFKGCTNVAAYTIETSVPPTLSQAEGTLSGKDQFRIFIKENTVGYYLADGSAWKTYEAHFDIPVVEGGIHHEAVEPTDSTRGYRFDCWENSATGKFYSDPYYSVEIDTLSVISYKKLAINPASNLDGFVADGDKEYDGCLFDHSVRAEYTSHSDCGKRKAEFYVYGKDIDNARIVWFKDHEHRMEAYGSFHVDVFVNDSLVYSKAQGYDDMEGLYVVPLAGLKTFDRIRFEVDKPDNAFWDYQSSVVTFAASLQYTRSGIADVLPVTLKAVDKAVILEAGVEAPEFEWVIESGTLRPGESLEGITLSREAGDAPGQYAISFTQPEGANPSYDITFKTGVFSILNGIHHSQSEPTDTTVGYQTDCWEIPSTGKFYSDAYATNELRSGWVVRYPAIGIDPLTNDMSWFNAFFPDSELSFSCGEYGEKKIGFGFSAFYWSSDADTRHASFYVNHEKARNARLVWHFREAESRYGLFSVKGYVNDSLAGTQSQTVGEMWDGFYTMSLGDLVGGDTIRFEVEKQRGDSDWGTTELSVTLEYIKEGAILPFPLTIKANSHGKIICGTDVPNDPELTWNISSGYERYGYKLQDITVSRVDGQEPGDYLISIGQPEGTNQAYNITFVPDTFRICSGVFHEECEPTDSTFGYAYDCYEIPATGMWYKDNFMTQKTNSVLAVKYLTLDISPVLIDSLSEKFSYEPDPEVGDWEYGGFRELNFAVETYYNPDYPEQNVGKRHAEFVVNHKVAKDARLVWYKDWANEYDGRASFRVYVNGTQVYCADQKDGNLLEGFFCVPLGNLKGNDHVRFEIERAESSQEESLIYASLEYVADGGLAVWPLTIKAFDNYKLTFDGVQLDDPELTWSLTEGYVRPDFSLPEIAISRTEGELPGTYDIKVSWADEPSDRYDVTFVSGKFSIVKGVHRLPCEPTEMAYGLKYECWEDTIGHKYYSYANPLVELNPADLFVYKRLPVSPVDKAGELAEIETGEYGGSQFNWAVDKTFTKESWDGMYEATFVVRDSDATNLRLKWYRGFPNNDDTRVAVNVCVNSDCLYEENAYNDDFSAEGLHAFDLPALSMSDTVKFIIDGYYDSPLPANSSTIVACLEYTRSSYTAITAQKDTTKTDCYFTTFYDSRNAYALGEDATAYTAIVDGAYVRLLPVEGGIIPRGEPVVILCNHDTVMLSAVASSAVPNPLNILCGTDVAIPAPDSCYTFRLGQKGLGFYQHPMGTAIYANKAYFTRVLPNVSGCFEILIGDEEPSGIILIGDDKPCVEDIYRLDGVRGINLRKGVNIVNGRKVLVK